MQKTKTLSFLFLIFSLYSFALQAQTTNRFTLNYQKLGSVNGVSAFSMDGQANHQFFLDEDGENLLTAGIAYSHTELDDSRATGKVEVENLELSFQHRLF